MGGEIGRAEFFSLALALCLSEALLLGTAAATAARAWLLVVLALLWGLIYPLLFYAWTNLFAGQSFSEALNYAFGRAGGRLALFGYALGWLLLAVVAASYVASFWASLGANNLPLWLYAALFLLVAAAFAATGGTALARVALLVVTPALLLTLANLLLTVWGADFGNLLPWQGAGDNAGNLWLTGLYFGLLFFGGLSALLPVLSQTAGVKKRWWELLLAQLLAVIVWLAFELGSRVALGASLPLYDFPILQVFRLAELGHWFSRFEVIGAALLVMLALLRVAALLAAAVVSLAELWQINSQQRGRVWLLALGCWGFMLIMFWLSRLFAPQPLELLPRLGVGIALWQLVFSVLLPLLAVITGAWRFRREHQTVVVKHEQY